MPQSDSEKQVNEPSNHSEIEIDALNYDLIGGEVKDLSLSVEKNLELLEELRKRTIGNDELINNLEARLIYTEATLQSTVDLTDDVLTNAAHAIENASEVTDFVVIIFTVVLAIGSLVFGISQWWFGKTKKDHVVEAGQDLVEKISGDGELQSDFLRLMLRHPEFVKLAREVLDNEKEPETSSADRDIAEISGEIGK